MRVKAKVDHTQKEIVEFLRSLGFSVISLANIGRGCPDLLCARGGMIYLIEVKNGFLGWKLTPDQRRFRLRWNSDITILSSIQDALNWVNSLNQKHVKSVVPNIPLPELQNCNRKHSSNRNIVRKSAKQKRREAIVFPRMEESEKLDHGR